MVIYTDIKPFIVAGFVLVFINPSDGLPLSRQRKARDSGSQGRMTMLKKSCTDPVGNIGVCMFKWDCISQRGITLSTCVDGFLFGACCALKDVSQGKWTYDNSDKSSSESDDDKRNTISLIKYVTLSFFEPKTALTAEEENEGDVVDIFSSDNTSTSTSFLNFTKGFQHGVTTDNEDASTTHKFTLDGSITATEVTSFDDLNNTAVNLEVISANNSFTISNTSDNDTSTLREEKKRTSVQTSKSNLGTLQLQSEIDSEKLLQLSQKVNFLLSSELIDKENKTVIKKESVVLEENIADITTAHSTYGKDSLEIPRPTLEANENNPYDSFNTEDKNLAFITEIKNESSLNSKEMLMNEQSQENTTFPSISRNKHIGVPSTNESDASVLPSGFDVVLSQLTHREALKENINPTVQSILNSSILNFNKTENFHLSVDNNLNSTLEEGYESLQTGNSNEKSTFLVPLLDELATTEKQNIEQVAERTSNEVISSTFPEIQEVNSKISSTVSSNTISDITQSIVNVNKDSSWIYEKDDTTSVTHDTQHSTNLLEVVTLNTPEDLQTNCNEGDKVINTNYYNHFTSLGNINFSVAYNSLDYEEIESTENFIGDILNFATNSPDYAKPADENYKNGESFQSTTFSITSDQSSSNSQTSSKGITVSSAYFNISNDKNDIIIEENAEQTTVATNQPVIPDPALSAASSLNNEEFLFDITTDILKYFTKSGNKKIDSAAGSEDNFISSDEKFFITPSQMQTQQVHDTSTENTISHEPNSEHSEIIINSDTENFGDNFFNLTTHQYNSVPSVFLSETNSINESTNYDAVTVKSFMNMSFTTEEVMLHEKDEISELNEWNTDFNELSSNITIFSTLTNVTPTTKAIMTETESKNIFSESNNEGTTKLVLNAFQDVTITDNPSPFTSLVNMSIPLKTENNSLTGFTHDYLNHENTSQNVDTSNITQSTISEFGMQNFTSAANFNMTSTMSTLANSTHTNDGSYFTTAKVTLSHASEKPIKNKTWNYKKDCGVRPMQAIGRIVGGRNTYFGKWPWQALVKEATWLGLFVKNKCGGVLITSKYVLTAAHCQPGFLASLLVVLGTHDLSNMNEHGLPIIRNVKRMVVHRHYNPQTFENDLALLEMEYELEFMPHIVPICLPHRNEDFTGKMAFVTGWGKLTHGGDVPNILQEVQVPIVKNTECQMMFYQAGHQKLIQNNFVCAGYTNGGQDSCEGDSGGPLMVQRQDKRWVLVGTVSHGIGCADPNLPGVYMRMSSYRPWIDSIINK